MTNPESAVTSEVIGDGDKSVLKLTLSGRMDATAALVLTKEIEKYQLELQNCLFIFSPQMDFINSTFLKAMVITWRKVTKAGHKFAIVNQSPKTQIQEIMEIAGFDMLFNFCPTVPVAMALLAA